MPNRKTKSRKQSNRSSRRRVARFAVSSARKLTKSASRLKSVNTMIARLKKESRRGKIGSIKASKSKSKKEMQCAEHNVSL